MLLVCAGLLIRSFLQVLDVNIGFQPERAAALRIDRGPRGANQAQRNAHYSEVLRRVRALPGVEGAGLSDVLPYGHNRSWNVGAKGRVYTKEDPPPDVFVRIVSDGYRKAMGIPMIAGRDFTESDTEGTKRVMLINQTLARTLFPGEDPIGKTIIYVDPEREVIGVVGDVRHLALEEDSGAEIYLPIRQTDDYASVDLIVRSSLPSSAIASAVRGALTPIEPSLAVNEMVTLSGLVDKAVSPRRFVVLLLGGFSAFALMLASLGIYGVISYTVDQRGQEMAIRLALGASVRELRMRIVVQTFRLAAVGMIIGFSVAWIAARAIGGLLFNVTTADPITFVGMLAVLTAVAALAGYLPARRVSKIDPAVALRASCRIHLPLPPAPSPPLQGERGELRIEASVIHAVRTDPCALSNSSSSLRNQKAAFTSGITPYPARQARTILQHRHRARVPPDSLRLPGRHVWLRQPDRGPGPSALQRFQAMLAGAR